MFFKKVYRYPEVLFNGHVFLLFKTSDMKKVPILIFISTILIPNLQVQSSKLKKHRLMIAYVFQKYPENFAMQLFIIFQ